MDQNEVPRMETRDQILLTLLAPSPPHPTFPKISRYTIIRKAFMTCTTRGMFPSLITMPLPALPFLQPYHVGFVIPIR